MIPSVDMFKQIKRFLGFNPLVKVCTLVTHPTRKTMFNRENADDPRNDTTPVPPMMFTPTCDNCDSDLCIGCDGDDDQQPE